MSEGTAVGFSAFDIKRFVNNGKVNAEEIIQHMDQGLAYGKLGFKFYPPMGFRAADNIEPKFEQVADIFFDRCLELNVPVFTHCTSEGFELVRGSSGVNSHPKYWAQALRKSPERANLNLCFGHAGGGLRTSDGRVIHNWLSDTNVAGQEHWMDPDNYARIVCELCRQYKNVYCDISYLHEILDSDEYYQVFARRLAYELSDEQNVGKPFHLGDKFMYGSDWHMKSVVNDLQQYFRMMRDIFETTELRPFKQRFFHKNALKYINLSGFLERAGEDLSSGSQQKLYETLQLSDSLTD